MKRAQHLFKLLTEIYKTSIVFFSCEDTHTWTEYRKFEKLEENGEEHLRKITFTIEMVNKLEL